MSDACERRFNVVRLCLCVFSRKAERKAGGHWSVAAMLLVWQR